MNMISCHHQERGLLQATGGFELSRQIRVALCCISYLSRAVRMGVPLQRVREAEWILRDELHEYFAFLPGARVKRGLETSCDVCGLVDVVKRVGFAKEGDDFIHRTWHCEVERAKYDWVEAFGEYAVGAGLKSHDAFGRRVERARVVMRFIQEFTPAVFVESVEPQLVTMVRDDGGIGAEELIRMVHIQTKALRHGHLRMIG